MLAKLSRQDNNESKNGAGKTKMNEPTAVVRRFLSPPEGSFFLFGPRGTGKSLWVRATFPDALLVYLLDPAELRRYQAHPEALQQTLAAHPEQRTVVLIEVQRCPALLDVVHGLIEGPAGLRFVLTGSSARKLRRADVFSAGGPSAAVPVGPWARDFLLEAA